MGSCSLTRVSCPLLRPYGFGGSLFQRPGGSIFVSSPDSATMIDDEGSVGRACAIRCTLHV